MSDLLAVSGPIEWWDGGAPVEAVPGLAERLEHGASRRGGEGSGQVMNGLC